jgi:hypothetical protein
MTENEVLQLKKGLYEVTWTDNTSDLVVVGDDSLGRKWMASYNWLCLWRPGDNWPCYSDWGYVRSVKLIAAATRSYLDPETAVRAREAAERIIEAPPVSSDDLFTLPGLWQCARCRMHYSTVEKAETCACDKVAEVTASPEEVALDGWDGKVPVVYEESPPKDWLEQTKAAEPIAAPAPSSQVDKLWDESGWEDVTPQTQSTTKPPLPTRNPMYDGKGGLE